jgi:hypothetical protein
MDRRFDTIFQDRPGIDVRLPASRHGQKADHQIQFRLPGIADIPEIDRFRVSPNPFLSRTANISFGALTFICELMKVRQSSSSPKGKEAVSRLLSIA